MLKIYHSQGARSLRVLWLCEEMGVPYETAEASFFKPSDEFKTINPLRTEPAMTDGNVTMIESVAMMIYIMAKHGPTELEVKPDEAHGA
jgi:glutathione S-transferase